MRLSTKSRYGVRALFDMAYNSGTLPVQIKDISRRQKISPRYLEQIFHCLKKAGILKSKRGPQGGYYLAKNPELISIEEIIKAAEGDIFLVDCLGKNKKKDRCRLDGCCVTQTVWIEATEKLSDYLSRTTLKMLCERGKAMGISREMDQHYMYFI